jgi:hypothetical protein
MPAQFCHLLFAEEALQAALGARAAGLLERHGSLFRFAAQGPDFFYHNQRTRPTGLKYGVAAHQEGYGRLTACLVREVRRLEERGIDEAERGELAAFTLGWTTHAFLDRLTHPFILYYSGWVDPLRPETRKYFRCHIFLERILDVLTLRERRGQEPAAFSLSALLGCGPVLPYPLVKTMLKALNSAYPRMRHKSLDRRRIDNSYADAMFFYTYTDPAEDRYRRLALERDREAPKRRLALFHPRELPADIDFLNAAGAQWRHPCHGAASRASFPQLYQQALSLAVPALGLVNEALAGRRRVEEVEAAVGNASLNTGLERSERCHLRYCDPLPLPQLLDELYRRAAAGGASIDPHLPAG